MPRAHAAQLEAPAPWEAVPGSHGGHVSRWTSARPAGHTVHADAPSAAAIRPGAHAWHGCVGPPVYAPAVQVAQALSPPPVAYAPAAHAPQLERPTSVAALPGTHAAHGWLALAVA